MDKKYLLTYQNEKSVCFEWFDTEEEMNVFINERDINVLEALFMKDAENIVIGMR